MALDFVCLTTFHARSIVETWEAVGFFLVTQERFFSFKTETSFSCPRLPPAIVLIEKEEEENFLRDRILKFFFFEKRSIAPLSKEGAIMISKKILFSFLARDTSHLLLSATTPPNAERLSTARALSYAVIMSLPTPTPQGELCFTITQAGSFLNSFRHKRAASPSR